MSGLVKALASTVGKKFVMGITGLLLSGFLVTHLAGNLLLYVGADAYNAYAHALHSKEVLIKIAEVGLAVLFLSHILLAVVTARENRAARQVAYHQKQSKLSRPPFGKAISAESWMFISGAVVLGFLLLHLADFTFQVRLQEKTAGVEPFEKAKIILGNPISAAVYLVGSLILGIHLSHGFASALQSLGISHPAYEKCIRYVGIVFSAVIAIGFASFVLWAWL